MTAATSLQMQVPAQVHEMRDWRGQFTHLYNLDIQLPTPARFDLPADLQHIASVTARGMTGYLYIDCQWERGLTGSYDPKKVRQRNDHVLVQPSIALLIKQMRTKLYPGDEEVFTLPVTHIGRMLTPQVAIPAAQPGQLFISMAPKQWEYIKIDSDLTMSGRTVHRPHDDSRLDAATNRLKYLYVHLVAADRAKLSVWLDQLFEEGVLT